MRGVGCKNSMRFKRYLISIALLLFCNLYGCSSDEVKINDLKIDPTKQNENKLMVKGASGWYVKYSLNGEPAFVGYGEYVSNVAPFSLNGVNILKVEAEQHADNIPRMVGAEIYTLKGPNKNLIKTFSSTSGEKSYQSELEFEFKTERKMWEISEEIDDFSVKDRKDIERIITDFEAILRSADIEGLRSIDMYQWTLKNTEPQKGIDKNLLYSLTKLLKSSKYNIDSAPLNELSFTIGKKLVLFYHHSGHIFKIETKESYKKKNEWHIVFPVLRLYFVKIKGNWEMMHLLDDTLMGG
jgi:hypothetical protein